MVGLLVNQEQTDEDKPKGQKCLLSFTILFKKLDHPSKVLLSWPIVHPTELQRKPSKEIGGSISSIRVISWRFPDCENVLSIAYTKPRAFSHSSFTFEFNQYLIYMCSFMRCEKSKTTVLSTSIWQHFLDLCKKVVNWKVFVPSNFQKRIKLSFTKLT